MQPEPVLEARALRKRHGHRVVLDGVDLALRPGERVALTGPSGSGKSTLLHCLAGLDTPDSGEIVLAGRSLAGLSPDDLAALRRTTCGTVFQFFHLLPTLGVAENVELPLQLAGWDRAARRARVAELLAEVGMESHADARPGTLSGGEMQRVAIARALGPRPPVVLADEPTGNLDSKAGGRVLALLEDLCARHGTALLLVTHSPEAAATCTRSLHLLDGRLVD